MSIKVQFPADQYSEVFDYFDEQKLWMKGAKMDMPCGDKFIAKFETIFDAFYCKLLAPKEI